MINRRGRELHPRRERGSTPNEAAERAVDRGAALSAVRRNVRASVPRVPGVDAELLDVAVRAWVEALRARKSATRLADIVRADDQVHRAEDDVHRLVEAAAAVKD